MATDNLLNLWMARTTTECSALGADDGLAAGDFCLVDGRNIYMATNVLAASSTWRPVGAGLPSVGVWGVGGKNIHDTSKQLWFSAAVPFRALLDAAPSSISISVTASYNWSGTPGIAAGSIRAEGFVLQAYSATISAGAFAYARGIFTILTY